MPFQPQPPFPKSRGDTVRSTDWNDLTLEVQRLDNAKVNRVGDSMSGSLSIAGTLAVGTTPEPDVLLRIQSSEADRSPVLALGTPGNEDFLSVFSGRRGNQLPFIAWKRGDLRFGTATGAHGANFTELLRINNATTAAARLEVDGRIRAGQLTIGAWPASPSDYVYFGSSALDQTQSGNYALLQHAPSNGGTTYLNSPKTLRLRINNADKLVVQADGNIHVVAPGELRFGEQTRQMIHLWRSGYGIGVQGGTQYFRTDTNFAWFRGGAHSDETYNPGGGVRLMALNSAGDLILSARTNPSADPKGSLCRALADLGQTLSINHGGDYANGVVMGGNLTVNGNAFKPGGGSWGSSSDRRLKQNIEPLDGALDRMLCLRGVQFEWREPERQGNLTGLQMGLIAQEVEDIFPDWVENDADGYKVLTIRGFEALTVEALRELKSDNDRLRLRVQQLEQQLARVPAQGRTTQRTNGRH